MHDQHYMFFFVFFCVRRKSLRLTHMVILGLFARECITNSHHKYVCSWRWTQIIRIIYLHFFIRVLSLSSIEIGSVCYSLTINGIDDSERAKKIQIKSSMLHLIAISSCIVDGRNCSFVPVNCIASAKPIRTSRIKNIKHKPNQWRGPRARR